MNGDEIVRRLRKFADDLESCEEKFMPKRDGNMTDGEFLQWLYERITMVFYVSPNIDWVLRFKRIVDAIQKSEKRDSIPDNVCIAWTCGSRRGITPDTTVIQSGRCRKMAVNNRFDRLESELKHTKKCVQELTDMVLPLRKIK